MIWLSSVLAVVVMLAALSAIYLSDYYHADETAIAAFAYSESISKRQMDDGAVAYIPEEPSAGLVFYPGGKVEAAAYDPLMMALAEKGVLSILVEMPFNLAVLDVNAADGIQEMFPQVEKWYIGGHSLGGSMAASYVENNTDDFDGLILLAAYSTADISETELNTISIYGSEDKVMNAEKYEKYKPNLPDGFTEYVIEGGCHAGFGVYGPQEGDGVPNISSSEQISFTAEKIAESISEGQ
ncbi:MAG: alpha/beta hydrolase [Ruminococcaceae bacterium]|nr:alpha/beta hydrolase [Oscillospiraceae bacterium]